MLNRLSEQIHLDTIVEHVSRTYCRPLSKNKKTYSSSPCGDEGLIPSIILEGQNPFLTYKL